MKCKGATACHTRSDCLFWTNTIPTFDYSTLEEEAIIRSSSFAGNFDCIGLTVTHLLITSV